MNSLYLEINPFNLHEVAFGTAQVKLPTPVRSFFRCRAEVLGERARNERYDDLAERTRLDAVFVRGAKQSRGN